ncbi:MAG TPA: AgmX/PglI C-terminal domain-containing protein [Polyangia bacterium]|jgi:TonB family protein|nr:AgmX/PglI C-terminal domain-containing protein [Polyangia bacterium]
MVPLPKMLALAVVIAAAASAPAAAAGDAAPEARPPVPAGNFTAEVQARVPEANRCYRAALETQPTLAGKLVVHFTVTPKGTVSNAVIRDSTLHNPKVEACIRDAVLRWTFTPPENAQDTHVAVPFDLGPELTASNVRLPPGVIARHVLDQSAVAYSAEKHVVVFTRCWTVAAPAPSPALSRVGGVPPSAARDAGAPAPAPAAPARDGGAPAPGASGEPTSGEGCVVVISPISPGATTKEIPVFGVGGAPDARARKKKETSAWTKLLPHLKGGSFVELTRTDWPAQAANLVLPQVDLVLVFSKDVIRVTRRPAKPATRPILVGEVKTSAPRGKVRPVAVYAAPDQRVMVIALREIADPAAAASASVTHFEVIDVLR